MLVTTAISLGYSFLEISLLIALAILFVSFTAPLNATLYTIAIFIIGHSLLTLKEYMSKLDNQFVSKLVDVCYYILPNLEKFDVRRSLLYGIKIPAASIAWSLVYWLVYTGLALFLAVQVMKKREV